jgi:hypothetical protein
MKPPQVIKSNILAKPPETIFMDRPAAFVLRHHGCLFSKTFCVHQSQAEPPLHLDGSDQAWAIDRWIFRKTLV